MNGTAVHGGTPPAERPNTTTLQGTACPNTPRCPTTPRETNGLRQPRAARCLDSLLFLLLLSLSEKVICIPLRTLRSSWGFLVGFFFVPSWLQKMCAACYGTPRAPHGRIRTSEGFSLVLLQPLPRCRPRNPLLAALCSRAPCDCG